MVYNFINDYAVIAHKKVLDKLIACAQEQNKGYGYDVHTAQAKKNIKKEIGNDNVDIYFLTGGTQTNLTLISGILRPFEAVICAETGHINVHETGAIEGRGHKCLICESKDAKVTVQGILNVLDTHKDEHMVKPKMVYISNATELGTFYTLAEIKALYEVCQAHNLYLYLDGARLASALTAEGNDLSLKDITKYCDAYYIGGTKNGGYIGEALVIVTDSIKPDFNYHIKHCGAMLAKGFVGAIPFEVLFEDGLYYAIGQSENECAALITKEMKKLGYKFYAESKTNQIFPLVTSAQKKYIEKAYGFETWTALNEDEYVIRLVTSFDTTKEICLFFIDYLKMFKL